MTHPMTHPKKRRWLIPTVALVSLAMWAPQASAQIPPLIAYGGEITDPSGQAINGTLDFTFRLYAGAQGDDPVATPTPAWEETHAGVAVTGGNFSVLLGSVVPLRTFPRHVPQRDDA